MRKLIILAASIAALAIPAAGIASVAVDANGVMAKCPSKYVAGQPGAPGS